MIYRVAVFGLPIFYRVASITANFGLPKRMIDQNWTDGANSVDQYLYTYDRNSNRTSKENVLHSDFDEDYTYDNLNRLIDTNRSQHAPAFQHGHQGGEYDAVLTNTMLFGNRVYDGKIGVQKPIGERQVK